MTRFFRLSKGLHTLVGLLFPLTAINVGKLVACTSDPAMESPSFAQAIADAVFGKQDTSAPPARLVVNPAFECYVGAHLPAGIMAWAALTICLVGYPLSALAFTLYHRAQIKSLSLPHSILHPLTALNFRPAYYWFHHLQLGLVALLGITLAFSSVAEATLAVFICNAIVLLAVATVTGVFKPYHFVDVRLVPHFVS